MDIRGFFRKLRKDDSGFTLIELIIAMAVLTVIMTPLLRAFLLSANTLAKSTAQGQVTVASENTAELVTSASFSSMTDLTTVEAALGTLESYDGSGVSVSQITSYNRGGITQAVLNSTDSVAYEITNAAMGVGDGIVDVVITPIVTGATSGDLNYNEMFADVNSSDYSSFTAMDKTWVQTGLPVTTENKVKHLDFLAESGGGSSINKRVITVTLLKSENAPSGVSTTEVKDSDGNTYPMVYYKVEYSYFIASSTGNGALKYDITPFEGFAFYGSDDIFSVQLVYLPCYSIDEVIEINNTDDIDCKFFLIKQDIIGEEMAFSGSNATLADDNGYSLDITLNETGSGEKLKLFTNVHQSIYDSTTDLTGAFTFQYNGGTLNALKDKLVDDASGGRGFNVLVRVFDKDDTLMTEVRTIKLM